MARPRPARAARRVALVGGLAASATGALIVALLPGVPDAAAAETVRVIVSEADPGSDAAERAVVAIGGSVVRAMPVVDGFVADVPVRARAALAAEASVAQVWDDAPVRMSDDDCDDDDDDDGVSGVGGAGGVGGVRDDDDCPIEDYDKLPPNTVWPDVIGLPAVPPGVDGDGVTVAVLDTGITRTPDLGDRVVARADLTPDGDGWDDYGHGTHMAGVVASDGTRSKGKWQGVATGVQVLPIRVASWNGATDVSMVLAAMEWVSVHREQYGIDVLSLSFGTDATQSYQLDPLDHAVERLWEQGVVVVAAAGNRGDRRQTIDKPATNPLVITVGAVDTMGTRTTRDDEVAAFSSRGPTADGIAKPDVLAPGVTIVSTRAKKSTIDAMRKEARLGKHYFKGTGTSQSTAMVAGVVALVLDAAPGLTPDQVKAILVQTAQPLKRDDLPTDDLPAGERSAARPGVVRADLAVQMAVENPPDVLPPDVPPATGTGLLAPSRGSYEPWTDLDGDGAPEPVTGETDALGGTHDGPAWAARPWTAETWAQSPWSELTNVSPGWTETAWPEDLWPGLGWDESSWTAKWWRDAGWNPGNWTAKWWRGGGWN